MSLSKFEPCEVKALYQVLYQIMRNGNVVQHATKDVQDAATKFCHEVESSQPKSMYELGAIMLTPQESTKSKICSNCVFYKHIPSYQHNPFIVGHCLILDLHTQPQLCPCGGREFRERYCLLQ